MTMYRDDRGDEGVRGRNVFDTGNSEDVLKKEDSDRSQLISTKEVSEIDSKMKTSVSPDEKPLVVNIPPAVLWRRLCPCSFKTEQWKYVNAIVAISSLGSFIWGYSFSVIGGAMLLIDDHFNLSVLWHETIVTMLVVGATVGAAIAGTLSDKFGRWKVMMTSTILHIVAAVVMALAFSEVFLVIGRTIAGLALGMVTTYTASMQIRIATLNACTSKLRINVIIILYRDHMTFYSVL